MMVCGRAVGNLENGGVEQGGWESEKRRKQVTDVQLLRRMGMRPRLLKVTKALTLRQYLKRINTRDYEFKLGEAIFNLASVMALREFQFYSDTNWLCFQRE